MNCFNCGRSLASMKFQQNLDGTYSCEMCLSKSGSNSQQASFPDDRKGGLSKKPSAVNVTNQPPPNTFNPGAPISQPPPQNQHGVSRQPSVPSVPQQPTKRHEDVRLTTQAWIPGARIDETPLPSEEPQPTAKQLYSPVAPSHASSHLPVPQMQQNVSSHQPQSMPSFTFPQPPQTPPQLPLTTSFHNSMSQPSASQWQPQQPAAPMNDLVSQIQARAKQIQPSTQAPANTPASVSDSPTMSRRNAPPPPPPSNQFTVPLFQMHVTLPSNSPPDSKDSTEILTATVQQPEVTTTTKPPTSRFAAEILDRASKRSQSSTSLDNLSDRASKRYTSSASENSSRVSRNDETTVSSTHPVQRSSSPPTVLLQNNKQVQPDENPYKTLLKSKAVPKPDASLENQAFSVSDEQLDQAYSTLKRKLKNSVPVSVPTNQLATTATSPAGRQVKTDTRAKISISKSATSVTTIRPITPDTSGTAPVPVSPIREKFGQLDFGQSSITVPSTRSVKLDDPSEDGSTIIATATLRAPTQFSSMIAQGRTKLKPSRQPSGTSPAPLDDQGESGRQESGDGHLSRNVSAVSGSMKRLASGPVRSDSSELLSIIQARRKKIEVMSDHEVSQPPSQEDDDHWK